MQQRWAQAIRREVGEHFTISPNTVVCSAHFEDSSFLPQVKLPADPCVEKKRKVACRLRSDAVPSIFSFRPAPSTPRRSKSDRLAVGASRAMEMAERKEAIRKAKMTPAEIELEKVKLQLEESKKEVAAQQGKVGALEERHSSAVTALSL